MAENSAEEVLVHTSIPNGTGFTDGAGPGAAQQADAPTYAQRVGAAGACFKFDDDGNVSDVGFHLESVCGKQTVPRAELVGWIGGNELNPELSCRSDSLHVVNGIRTIKESADVGKEEAQLLRKSNYDLWRVAFQALEDSHATLPTKVKAHTKISQVVEGEVT